MSNYFTGHDEEIMGYEILKCQIIITRHHRNKAPGMPIDTSPNNVSRGNQNNTEKALGLDGKKIVIMKCHDTSANNVSRGNHNHTEKALSLDGIKNVIMDYYRQSTKYMK